LKDKVYWDAYYKSNPPINFASDFAMSITKYLHKGQSIVDLGCGNGRDSLYFNGMGLNVLGVDSSCEAIDLLNKKSYLYAKFLCGDFIDNTQIYQYSWDYFYSRFTLHAISEKDQDRLLQNIYSSLKENGLFFVETRSINDDLFGKGEPAGRNAFIYDDHYRRFIVNTELINELKKNKFEIVYNEEAKGFAKFGNEDPSVIRVIACK